MKTYPASDFANIKVKARWAVEKLIPANGLCMIIADPKVGKSVLSMQLAHALARQGRFLDRQTHPPQQGPWKVLYVQADMPEEEWSDQRSAFSSVSDGWDYVWLQPGALTLPGPVKDLKDTIAANGYNMVIYDALITLFAGVDFVKDIGGAQLIANRVRDISGKSLSWIIHHKRKPAPGLPDMSINSILGNVALGAALSAVYDLKASSLRAQGRIVKADMGLKRDSTGLWLFDPQNPVP